MEQAPLANKPDVPVAVLDNLTDPPDKLAVAVIYIMRKCFGRWIKLVDSAVLSAKPKRASITSGDARHVSGTDTIGVVGIMKVAGTTFGCRVEFVHPSVGGNP